MLDHALEIVAIWKTEEAVSLDGAVVVTDEKGNEIAGLFESVFYARAA